MKQQIDARGKQCPLPVIETKKALKEISEGLLEVLVDNEIAVQNLSKMAKQMKLNVSSEKVQKDEYKVSIEVLKSSAEGIQSEITAHPIEDTTCPIEQNELETLEETTIVVLSTDHMGEGNEELGKTLMKGFIYALTELDKLPKKILMYNSGAKLAIEGSDSLEDLKLLESKGVEVLTCGACLNFYGISDQLAVGSVTNMYIIAESMMAARKIIKP